MHPRSLTTDPALELGIFAKTFRRSSVGEVFDAIAGHELTCTQWNWACVPGFSSLPDAVPIETAREVARAASASGVRIAAVSATFNLIQPGARERALAQFPALAEAAMRVGCDLLTLCTGTRHPHDMWTYHPANESAEAWDDMIDGLRQVSRIACRYGVRLGIEPETANVISDARTAERALRELDSDAEPFSIILDAANLYRPPVDPRAYPGVIDDALARLGQRIGIAHAKDIAAPNSDSTHSSLEHYMHVAAGTGILPYPTYLAGLQRVVRKGQRLPLILHGLEEEQVAASVAFVRSSMRAIAASVTAN